MTIDGRFSGWLKKFAEQFLRSEMTHAQHLATADLKQYAGLEGRHFSLGNRPVIRWIKGNGLDDAVTRAAIAQATRLFGSSVDYCLCTHDIAPARARHIMSLSAQPVEWWPVSQEDNPPLAAELRSAGCVPEHFGYWWKWFPARVRPNAPEWILDGDMVIVDRPEWFDLWRSGNDGVRVAQDDKEGPHIYGRYSDLVDRRLALYSGLISLPPGFSYMPALLRILRNRPLDQGHDGRSDMCEQGVIAACFQGFNPVPIPLNEFPFGRAFQAELDFGLSGNLNRAWGYHFGNSFRRHNPHFEALTRDGTLFSGPEPFAVQAANWLGGFGQWGIPGWSTGEANASMILRHALCHPSRDILELGTSRGHMTFILAVSGFRVTSVDRVDRGARQNLEGMSVDIVVDDVVRYLKRSRKLHDLILVDLHGNSPKDWKRYRTALMSRVTSGGTLLINNAILNEIPEWQEEHGVQWFLSSLPANWSFQIDRSVLPGLAIVTKH